MTIIEEIFNTIAETINLPVWVIPTAIDRNDLNQLADAGKYPCLAYLFDQPFAVESDYQATTMYSTYTTRVWFLGKPSDERPESLLATKKQLEELAFQFRQVFQKAPEFVSAGNNVLNGNVSSAYPQFDARLVAVEFSFTVKLDMGINVCSPAYPIEE